MQADYVACGNPRGAWTTKYIYIQPFAAVYSSVAELVATASGLQTTNMLLLNMHITISIILLAEL